MMRKSLFKDHPASVGESYTQHMATAAGFGVQMLVGGLVCLVHSVFPFLFEKTGSGIVTRLHDRMVVNRHRLARRDTESLGGWAERAK